MKRIISLLMCFAMLCSLHIGAMAETYEGVAAGFGGEIKVSAHVEGGKLTAVEVISHGETAGISDPAFTKIPQAIIENQSVAVDTVAGCTFSSKGLIEAITAAWVASGANLEDISKEIIVQESNKTLETKNADVVIIGAGGAGMTAAVEVLRNGGSVIVVEKMSSVGGNTIAAGSALNAAGTDIQKNGGSMTADGIEQIEAQLALEPKNDDMKRWQESVRKDLDAYIASGSTAIFDSTDLHKLQTYVGGDYIGKTELIETLCDQAPKAVEYLSELGTTWKSNIIIATGATWARSHQPMATFGPKGSDFVLPQVEFVKANGGEIILEHKAEELLMDNDRVIGVKGTANDGTPFEYTAKKGVILATGGFGANVEMRQKYNKHWPNLDENVHCSNLPCSTGDGITMASAIGANLIDMEWIQMVTGSTTKFSASIANNIYVNADGERFIAEDSRRDVLSDAVLAQKNSTFWFLTDAHEAWDIQGGLGYGVTPIEDMLATGIMFEAQTIEELAQITGMDAQKLQNSIDQFNKAVSGEEEDPLGRKLFQYPFDKGPYYASVGYAFVHHTMGGVEINANCEVLNTDGNVIPGIYACGEVTGGIHGGNRLGGNAIADVIVFGQIAGQNAMK